MDEYLRAKLRIFENQDNNDWAIIYFEEEERVGNIKTKKVIYGNDKKSELIVKDALLKGRHNQDNIQAAFLASKICGVENETIINAVLNFKPLAHRMEYVDKINDIIFIDDSKATNVHAVIPALHSLQCPVMLILGGRDKGDDFTRLEDTIREKVSGVVVIGEAKDKIIKQLNGIVPIYESATLEDAVKCSYKNAKNNTTVLLSPGCSSFDMFKDYKERGNRFKEAVRNLKIKTQNTNLKNTLLNAVIS
jgi:UDP-N-acetylmuramoylalanine--D-glutamate ligase